MGTTTASLPAESVYTAQMGMGVSCDKKNPLFSDLMNLGLK